MGLSGVVDRSDARIDVRFVAQASALGALADDVLADLLWSRAVGNDLSSSPAVSRAATLFSTVVAEESAPVGLWQRHEVADALRKMTAAQSIAEGAAPPSSDDISDQIAWLKVVADALTQAHGGQASSEQLTLLKDYFEAIANSTIEAAAATIHSRGAATAWLTI